MKTSASSSHDDHDRGPTARSVSHAVAAGTFTLDGETFDVENNIWVVGDDRECVVIDAPHSVDSIVLAVNGRHVRAVLCTHAHDDHVRVAPALREATGAPIFLHPADEPLWDLVHGGDSERWDVDLEDGSEIEVGGITLRVIHTPGHSPGAVCFYSPELRTVFTGDTLFCGGPGATGRSYSDREQLEDSIRAKLYALPAETIVRTGHGENTTIGAERDLLG